MINKNRSFLLPFFISNNINDSLDNFFSRTLSFLAKPTLSELISSRLNVGTPIGKFKNGIIYTLYSDKFNSLKVGFAENDKVLEKKLSSEALILLDMKKGKKKDLRLLITTLNELGIKYSDNFYFKYSGSLMKHLSTLGWPIGSSLYKQRKIKKELVCAQI